MGWNDEQAAGERVQRSWVAERVDRQREMAPEMLEELRRVREHFAGCSHCSGTEAAVWHERLTALIAKAEG